MSPGPTIYESTDISNKKEIRGIDVADLLDYKNIKFLFGSPS